MMSLIKPLLLLYCHFLMFLVLFVITPYGLYIIKFVFLCYLFSLYLFINYNHKYPDSLYWVLTLKFYLIIISIIVYHFSKIEFLIFLLYWSYVLQIFY